MTLQDVGILVAIFLATWALLRTFATAWQQERDARFFEFWLRSAEQRKADTPEVIAERERMKFEKGE